MVEEEFWALVSLMLAGEASPEDMDPVDAYCGLHPEVKDRLAVVQSVWQSRPAAPASSDQAFSRHLQRLSNHLSEPALQYEISSGLPQDGVAVSPSRRLGRMIFATGIAASLLFGFLIIFPFKRSLNAGEATPKNTVSTKPGSRSKIQLPDGTEVWLNADSRLEYGAKFGGETRSVYLSGEAYFDVVKDKDHPFIIHTSTVDIKVLGTAFNVRSYQNEKSTETSLFRGSVEIIAHNNPERKIILKPLEKLVIQNMLPPEVRPDLSKAASDDKPMMILSKVHIESKDSTAKEILWMHNKLSFDSEPLEDVALKIERWYGVSVQITDERIRRKEYTAVFEDENLEQVMEALRLTGNFRYLIDKKQVIIKP